MNFRNLCALSAALLSVPLATPALAQEEEAKPVTVSGSVGLVSEYRFRGVSQSDRNLAIQGGLTIAHESGFYVGTWGSNLAGWGTFGGANMELDLIAGYKKSFGNATVDVGATWYMYPKGFDNTDFIEPYIKVSGTTGPVTLTAGVAYAPQQEALGAWYATGADAAAGVYTNPGDKNDNLYLWGDAAAGTTTLLQDAVGAWPQPTGTVFVWVGAERATTSFIKENLLARGLDADTMRMTAYWTKGG